MKRIRTKRILVLASTSPRRKELLASSGLQFNAVAPRVAEDRNSPLPPRKFVEKAALLKALDVTARVTRGSKSAVIIGADTILFSKGTKLGKPRNRKDAFRMLKMISGRTVRVYTGLAIVDTKTGRKSVCSDRTTLTIMKLTDNEIRAYIKTSEPLDKAGAIAIQGRGAKCISRIEGSRSNAIGLPLELLRRKLNEFGVTTPSAKR